MTKEGGSDEVGSISLLSFVQRMISTTDRLSEFNFFSQKPNINSKFVPHYININQEKYLKGIL